QGGRGHGAGRGGEAEGRDGCGGRGVGRGYAPDGSSALSGVAERRLQHPGSLGERLQSRAFAFTVGPGGSRLKPLPQEPGFALRNPSSTRALRATFSRREKERARRATAQNPQKQYASALTGCPGRAVAASRNRRSRRACGAASANTAAAASSRA